MVVASASSLTMGLDTLSDIDMILSEIRNFSCKEPKPKNLPTKVSYSNDYRNVIDREVQLRMQAVEALSIAERKHRTEMNTCQNDLKQIQGRLMKVQQKEMEIEEQNRHLKTRIEALESELQVNKQNSKAEKLLVKRATFYAVHCSRLLKAVNHKLQRVRKRCKIATDEVNRYKEKSREELDELRRREHRQSNYIMLLEARLRAGEKYGRNL